MTFGMYGTLFLLPLFWQEAGRLSPTMAGLALMPMAAVFVLVSPFSGFLGRRLGTRMMTGGGVAIIGCGLLSIAAGAHHVSILPAEMGLGLTGLGMGMATGFAKLTMLQELQFSETVYGLGAGVFFLGYFFFEVPSNMLLERIGAKRTLARITIGWGIICVLMMFVTKPWQFYSLRFLLGVFEAGFYPGVILYLTYWFPSLRRAKVFGLFMSASALAGVLGGPVAGTIMTQLGGVNGWAGWQWVFLLEGIPSILAGLATLCYLTDRPEHAHWLSADERHLLIGDLERDRQALGHREHSVLQSLKNPIVWKFIAIFFCIIMANSALTFFGPTIVREVGFTNSATVGWIMAAIYACGAAGMISNGIHSDRANEERYHCGLAALAGAVGLTVLGFVVPGSAPIALLALGLAVVGTMSAIPVFWQIPNHFLAGSAAAVGIALINSVANLAGFGAPYLMRYLKDAGAISNGLWIVAVVEAATFLLIVKFVARFERRSKPA
ncbi:MFS transporter [Labrys sedimenti]|uniref:MFS transporter n=1 Tax=Labrys sedimenti TaxID=3106036 RepID=UPI002ACADA27|nr:MFS transporter [Labrys sp. ZIDIC5]MDZ5449045.1 MFS transporter [Labrys sp. ZIDIC5]